MSLNAKYKSSQNDSSPIDPQSKVTNKFSSSILKFHNLQIKFK